MLNPIDTTLEATESNSATYCPEDNKLRIYIDGGDGRVSRESWLHIKSCGYKPTPKQSCTFVAHWSPKAEDAAIELIPDYQDIEDEDISPEERAVQRAERFAGYRDKRRSEAHELADNFDSMGSVYGNQCQNQADKNANKAKRTQSKSISQWSKSNYWQARTEGVIGNALHKSSASVRRNRILEIEKDIRRIESKYTPNDDGRQTFESDGKTREHAWCGKGRGGHWVAVDKLESIKQSYSRTIEHLSNRLLYENAMLENEGGKVSEVDIIAGGFIAGKQVLSVNKSRVTGRVVSVKVIGEDFHNVERPVTVNIERLGADDYRAPTEEELKAFKAANKKAPAKPKLLNLTNEDAEKLQKHWNSLHPKYAPQRVKYMTQVEYTYTTKRTDSLRTYSVTIDGEPLVYRPSVAEAEQEGRLSFKVRGGSKMVGPDFVIVLTDKPQKKMPITLEKKVEEEKFQLIG